MEKGYLTLDDYIKFLDTAVYDPGTIIQNENKNNFKLSPKKFCEIQVEKFEGKNGTKTGCCLNFSAYLLKKYRGFILTCRDNGGIHCAFVYQKKGSDDLYVCDPAKDKIFSVLFGGNAQAIFYDIPLRDFEFQNVVGDKVGEQEYSLRLGFDSEDSDGAFVNKLLKGESITVSDLHELDEEKIAEMLNAKQKTSD